MRIRVEEEKEAAELKAKEDEKERKRKAKHDKVESQKASGSLFGISWMVSSIFSVSNVNILLLYDPSRYLSYKS